MTFRIRLFAVLRERAGSNVVGLGAEPTVAEALRGLGRAHSFRTPRHA